MFDALYRLPTPTVRSNEYIALFEISACFTVRFISNTFGFNGQLLTMQIHPKLVMSLLLAHGARRSA
jgi:hypothetical protein